MDRSSSANKFASSATLSEKKKKTTFNSITEYQDAPNSPLLTPGKDYLNIIEQNQSKSKQNNTFSSLSSSYPPKPEYQTIHSLVNFDNLNIDFDDFYYEKVQSITNERSILDSYLSMIEPKKDKSHQLIWYNRNIIDELQQNEIEHKELMNKMVLIQKEIENIEKEIFHEKEQKQTRLERISVLESLGRPVEQDTTYIIPEQFSKSSKLIHDIGRQNRREKAQQKAATTTVGKEVANNNTNNFMKLIKSGEILVMEKKLESETMKIYSLLQDMNERIGGLVSEKHTLEEQFTQVSEKEFNESYKWYEIVKEAEYQSYYLIEELLALKYRIWVAQREEMEELEQLVKDRTYFQQKQTELKDKLLKEMEHTKKIFKDELDDCTREFDRQLSDLNMQMKNLSHKHAVLQNKKKDSSHKEEKLLHLLDSNKERYEKLQRRYRLEMEGYQTEVTMLKKQLQSLQKFASDQEKAEAKEAKERRKLAKQRRNRRKNMLSSSSYPYYQRGEVDDDKSSDDEEVNTTNSTIEEEEEDEVRGEEDALDTSRSGASSVVSDEVLVGRKKKGKEHIEEGVMDYLHDTMATTVNRSRESNNRFYHSDF